MAYQRLPAGVQDVLPRECRLLNNITARLRGRLERCGFETIQPAALEYYDGYADIAHALPQESMFKMTDTDGRLVVLRPDMTLSIARIAATKLPALPVRLSYVADKWSLQPATSAAASREICQAGVECLGEEGAFSDAQAIALAVECLKETGLNDFILDIGHVGYLKGMLEDCGLGEEDAERVADYINAKDALNAERILTRAGAGSEARNGVLALPMLFGGAEVLDRALALTKNPQALAAVAQLKEVNRLLVQMGYESYICYDLGAVKKFSYYSGIVFTGLVREMGAPVLSGGRYDDLADDFGRHIPAVGFAMGLKRILVALERQGLITEEEPPLVLVAAEGAEGAAYRRLLEMVRGGTRVRLSPLRGEEGRRQEELNGCRVLYITEEEA